MAALEIIALDTATPQLRAPRAGDTYVATRDVDLQAGALTLGGTSPTTFVRARFARAGGPSGRLVMAEQFSLCWAEGYANSPTNFDLALTRDAANTLALVNGANAQAFNVYNTFTDASNYERLAAKWVSNRVEITTENAGTGTARGLTLNSLGNGATSFQLFAATEQIAQAGRTNGSDAQLRLSSAKYGLTFGAFSTGNATSGLREMAAGVIRPHDGSGNGGALGFIEQTAPAAPAANGVVIYAEDNGAGKTRLMALFATGAAQQIAIEP